MFPPKEMTADAKVKPRPAHRSDARRHSAPSPAGFLVRVVSESRKAPARVWRAALDGLLDTDRFAGLPRTAIPSLLIWGDRDALFSRAEQQALVDALPVSSLRVYRETDHAPHWERPKEVVRYLERFLRSVQS